MDELCFHVLFPTLSLDISRSWGGVCIAVEQTQDRNSFMVRMVSHGNSNMHSLASREVFYYQLVNNMSLFLRNWGCSRAHWLVNWSQSLLLGLEKHQRARNRVVWRQKQTVTRGRTTSGVGNSHHRVAVELGLYSCCGSNLGGQEA